MSKEADHDKQKSNIYRFYGAKVLINFLLRQRLNSGRAWPKGKQSLSSNTLLGVIIHFSHIIHLFTSSWTVNSPEGFATLLIKIDIVFRFRVWRKKFHDNVERMYAREKSAGGVRGEKVIDKVLICWIVHCCAREKEMMKLTQTRISNNGKWYHMVMIWSDQSHSLKSSPLATYSCNPSMQLFSIITSRT